MNSLSRILILALIIVPAFGLGQDMSFKTFDKIRAGVRNSIEFDYSVKYDSIKFWFQEQVCNSVDKIIYVTPTRLGKDTLFAEVFKKGKIIYKSYYVLECEPIEVFGAFHSRLDRKISVPYLNAFKGVIVYAKITHNHWEAVEVKSYRITLLRSGTIVYTSYETDWRYSESTVKAVRGLKRGDLIVISEILPRYPDTGLMRAVPTVYEID